MNEQRQQDYLNLIQALLDSPNGEEVNILNAHPQLIDADLVEEMAKVAEMMAQQGNQNTAEFLNYWGQQITAYVGNTLSASPQEYIAFLDEVCQAASDSQGNKQVVYPILAANQDKLNRTLVVVYENWANHIISQVTPEEAPSFAGGFFYFSNLIQQFPLGNRTSNLDIAIIGYELVLNICTRADFPQDWATTQNNLATAYSNKITGKKAENIDAAIRCFRLALEFRTPTTLPLDCLQSGRNLGNLAFREGLWETAIEGYELAINAVEQSRSWSTTDASRQEILAESIDVYENIIQAYINSGKIDKAIEYVDRSSSKRLVDLMASNDLYAGGEIPPEVQQYLQQHDTLQAQIDAERERLQAESDSRQQQTDKPTDKGSLALARATREAATQTIIELEAQKQQVWEQMRRLDPVLAGEVQVTPLDFATIQKLLDSPKTAILNFFTTNNDTHIFIIYKNQSPQLHTCTGFGYQTLQELVVDEWLNPYLNKKNDGGIWFAKISEFLQRIAEKLQLTTLVEKHLTNIEELIIIPHLFWHQIPFAALPLTRPTQNNSQPPENQPSGKMRQVIQTFTRLEKKNNTINNISTIPPETEVVSTQYLGDKFRLRYVPSCQILQYCQQRPP